MADLSITDTERLAFLEHMARKSQTGISLDWIPSVGGERSGFRFMRCHHIGEPCPTVREAIDREINR